MKLRLGELCAGYGGLGLAVEEVFNAESAWFSEFDAAPSKILSYHWPDVPNYGDMTKIDWSAIEPADIISGGTPCQDLSAAGARRGMSEGTRSNLWVQMREAIAIQKPQYVVWENVRGAYSATATSDVEFCAGCMGNESDCYLRALGRVLGDLFDLGYDCQWRGLRAADVGAPHGRFRVFVLATHASSTGARVHTGSRGQEWGTPNPRGAALVRPDHGATLAEGGQPSDCEPPAHPEGVGRGEGWPESAGVIRGSNDAISGGQDLPDSISRGRNGRSRAAGREAGPGVTPERGSEGVAWGDYESAIRRWERVNGPAPRPTEPTGRAGAERLSPRFTEWMMGLPDGWVTDPAIGISRNEQLKACGNGVVPQQAIAALSDMLAAFNQERKAA